MKEETFHSDEMLSDTGFRGFLWEWRILKILAFDTSNQPLSVAVVAGNQIMTEQLVNVKRNHSLQLMPAIDEALRQANISLDKIDRIAVAAGPGSYTGLRIAVTIAKSLAWSRDIELVGISSLKVIAANSAQHDEETLIVPLFDARRKNIYTGLYQKNKAGELIQIEADTHLASDKWAAFLASEYEGRKLELIGVDAPAFLEVFQEKLGDKVQLAPVSQHLPRASVLAFLAQKEQPVDSHHFVPTYLKLAEAEENWLKEHPEFEGGDFVEKI